MASDGGDNGEQNELTVHAGSGVKRGTGINDKADPEGRPLAGIGTAGFEPATPATPLQCATGLRYVPLIEAEF